MNKYLELKKNTENQNVINEFLLYLRNTKKSETTIRNYKKILYLFLKQKEMLFSSITPGDIDEWIEEYKNKVKERSIRDYLSMLRSFYKFCVMEGHMVESPIKKIPTWEDSEENYWEVKIPLLNDANEKILNEFLQSLKKSSKSKYTIMCIRQQLQSFFKERETPFSLITPDDINEWFKKHQKEWNKKTIRNNSYYLRTFFDFCLDKGFIEKTPIQNQKRGRGIPENYWVLSISLPRLKNEEVLSEYLLNLKTMNYSHYTIMNYRYFLQMFFNGRQESFSDLTSHEIQKWLLKNEKGLKEKTIQFRLNTLKNFFAYCVEEGYIDKSPIKTRWFPRLPKPIPKYLEKDDMVKVQQQGEKESLRNRTLLEFLLSSGCRIGEVYLLNRENLDMEERTAWVFGKGRKFRQVHFSVKCGVLLERYLDSRVDNEPAVFVTSTGKPTRLSIGRMRFILSNMGDKVALSGSLHPHRLRHTFATELYSKGADLSFIADELGHKDLKTTQIYAHIPKREIISTYRKFMG
ncbi:tyrosine-type recombinase/integrase [Bacillus coreaensis]